MTEERNKTRKILLYTVSALVLCLVFYVRIRLFAVPLERDEGEAAYMGQLLLKGIKPFTLAYSLKPLGASFMYALFLSFFGQTPSGIHLGLLIVNLLCIGFVYLLARRLFHHSAAMISAASYGMLSLSQSVFGVFAHGTHFVVLFVLAGFVLLLHAMENKSSRLFLVSGLCFGLAMTMKQHAIFFIFFAFLYVAWWFHNKRQIKSRFFMVGGSSFLMGTLLPYTLMFFYILKSGSFDKFWFWTVLYAREYVSETSFSEGLTIFSKQLTSVASRQLPLWLLAALGIVFTFSSIGKTRKINRAFIAGFLLFSFLALWPGMFFREHYFIMFLPAIALMGGAALFFGENLFSQTKYPVFLQSTILALFFIAFAFGTIHEKDYLFFLSPSQVSRDIYGRSPFPESVQISAYLKMNTSENDNIAVMGSEPQIYFYADRLSATGHICMYGLMEKQPYAQSMQLEMIREIEAAQPRYIVMVKVNSSWLGKPDSLLTVIHWGERYLREQYDRVGVIDIINGNTTRYLWGEESIGYTPASKFYVTVHKRKS